jgi:1-acyl-sn-glycerol-3-phosphate acyltransferase
MLPTTVANEVRQRLQRLELPFNRYGVDPFGISKKHLRRSLTVLGWFYRNYFKVHVHGLEHVPDRGRAMLIGNHSGGVALDAAMVIGSVFLEKNPPRLAQGMVEKFMNQVPFLSEWTNRTGQFTGLPEHAVQLLENERLLMVFPEGARGTAKLYRQRYSLVRFGTGFMRLALRTGSPIVPFAFLGGGEAIPTIHNSRALGNLLHAPYVPITPYGAPIPLPVRLDVIYSPPMHFEGTGNEEDTSIQERIDLVRDRIGTLIDLGRRARREELDLESKLRGLSA